MSEPLDVASDIDISAATPELLGALAAAQSRAATVKKAGFNEHARYRYATAEDMIAAGRTARQGTGLALVMMPTVPLVADARWVRLRWVLTHESGGCIRGQHAAPVQPSKRNGTDKQIAALATYLHGFVERDLMSLDREGTPPDEDRDAQADEPAQVDHAAELRRIRAAIARLAAAGDLTEERLSSAVRVAATHGADEATVLSWVPAGDPEGVFPDISALSRLAECQTADALYETIAAHRVPLLAADRADLTVALGEHAERLEADMMRIDEALRPRSDS